MKVVGLIYLIRTSLSTSKYGVCASLTILKNGEQQLALAHLFLKTGVFLFLIAKI